MITDHYLMAVVAGGEYCSCGVTAPTILEHLAEVALAEIQEAA